MKGNTYQIQATVEHTTNDGWRCSPQVPTFFVWAVSAGEAAKKAAWILNPHGEKIPHFTVYCEATSEFLDYDDPTDFCLVWK